MKKFSKISILIILILGVVGTLAYFSYLPNTSASTIYTLNSGVCTTTTTPENAIATGLATAPNLSERNLVTSSGACIIDPKTAFAPYKIPTFDDLKSLYYTQSKAAKTDATPASGTATQGTIRSALNSYDVVLIRGNLELNGNLGGTSKTAVILVDDGDLNFGSNFIFGDENSGVVFIVSGDVNIDEDVTRIDAIIIAGGTIYTAGADCTNSSVNTSALTINGSLVSLTESSPAKFCRTLADNTNPAELINHQVKYLVILRNLMSDTFQRWSEIP